MSDHATRELLQHIEARLKAIERTLGIRRGKLYPNRKDGDFYETCQGIPAREFEE